MVHKIWPTLNVELRTASSCVVTSLTLNSCMADWEHCLMSRNIWKATQEFCMKFSFHPRMLSWECPPFYLFTALCNLRLHSEIESFMLLTSGSTASWNVLFTKSHAHVRTQNYTGIAVTSCAALPSIVCDRVLHSWSRKHQKSNLFSKIFTFHHSDCTFDW